MTFKDDLLAEEKNFWDNFNEELEKEKTQRLLRPVDPNIPNKTLSVEKLEGWVIERNKQCKELKPKILEQLQFVSDCIFVWRSPKTSKALRDEKAKQAINTMEYALKDIAFFIENVMDYQLLLQREECDDNE